MDAQNRKRYGMWGLAALMALLGAGGFQIAGAAPFDSLSTCVTPSAPTCLGAFTPAVSTQVVLPPDGILDYTTVNIPNGVTVTFLRNTANTPVMIRTTGTVTIAGTINVSALVAPTNSGTAGDGNLGDDGQPGLGGPGGYDGGFGGYAALFGGASGREGGSGKGPGGGQTGKNVCNGVGSGGGGGAFAAAGGIGGGQIYCGAAYGGQSGAAYGQPTLLPLVGGSGGGGGAAGTTYTGAGGGGGGGAIQIAAGTASSPATIYVASTGRIFANGGSGGGSAGSGSGGAGGSGSGGGIRLVAEKLDKPAGGGVFLQATGAAVVGNGAYGNGGAGSDGRVRIEANINSTWAAGNCDPACTIGLPGHSMVPNNPTLVISSVTATSTPVVVPANPTGNADITFPEGTTIVTVNVTATNIPRGTPVTIYVVPASGAPRTSALTPALDGASDALTTASVSVNLSPGNNVLLASATYTVTEIIAFNLPTFDDGIRVAKIRVDATMDGKSTVTYITAAGKEYPADSPLRDKVKKG